MMIIRNHFLFKVTGRHPSSTSRQDSGVDKGEDVFAEEEEEIDNGDFLESKPKMLVLNLQKQLKESLLLTHQK